ncbi:MAG: hypothetical protein JXJ04_23295, partial [Spirochaetales bacterium]|nr:hypothetical protein [Spirochaetales bacterium]
MILLFAVVIMLETIDSGIKVDFFIEIICIVVATILSLWIIRITKQKIYYDWMKYLVPFLDITLLSIVIYIISLHGESTLLVMHGAAPLLYFVFLVLSALRNSISSVIVTGVYISLSYGLLSLLSAMEFRLMETGYNVFTSSLGMKIIIMPDDEIIKIVIFGMVTAL